MIMTQNLQNNFLTEGNVRSTGISFTKGSKAGSLAMLNAQRVSNKMLDHFFSPIEALSSKPVYTYTTDKVIINVFYFIPKRNRALNNNTINNLGELLSKVFGRPVELRLVKLHYPYLNSTILAKYIGMNADKYKFRQIKRKIIGKSPIIKDIDSPKVLSSQLPSHIVGIKIRISGRLVTERVRPRQTVVTTQIGSFVNDNKSLIDCGSYTGKNIHGAYTIKVWISQRVA